MGQEYQISKDPQTKAKISCLKLYLTVVIKVKYLFNDNGKLMDYKAFCDKHKVNCDRSMLLLYKNLPTFPNPLLIFMGTKS